MEKGKKERREEMREIMKRLDIKDMEDINALFKEMVDSVLENGLEAELEEELGYSKYDHKNREGDNYRNGRSKKTMRSSFGEVEIGVPRDRNGEFEPTIVKKQQTTLSGDIEEKIISLYAKGMTQSDIEAHIQEIYGLEIVRPMNNLHCSLSTHSTRSGAKNTPKSPFRGERIGRIWQPISNTPRKSEP